MTGIYESISVCLYAAGAALMTAAAVVYKRNGLYEYYCLMHGKPVKAKKTNDTAERPAVRTMDTGTTLIKDVQVQETTPGYGQQGRSRGYRKSGRRSSTGAMIRRCWEKKAVRKTRGQSMHKEDARGESQRESSG